MHSWNKIACILVIFFIFPTDFYLSFDAFNDIFLWLLALLKELFIHFKEYPSLIKAAIVNKLSSYILPHFSSNFCSLWQVNNFWVTGIFRGAKCPDPPFYPSLQALMFHRLRSAESSMFFRPPWSFAIVLTSFVLCAFLFPLFVLCIYTVLIPMLSFYWHYIFHF